MFEVIGEFGMASLEAEQSDFLKKVAFVKLDTRLYE